MPLKVSGARLARFEHGNPRDDAPRLRFSARITDGVCGNRPRRAAGADPVAFLLFSSHLSASILGDLTGALITAKAQGASGSRTGGHQPREQVQRLCAEVAGWG